MQKEVGPLGRLKKDTPVQIIGAGVSGLLIAYYLKKYGHSVQILEKDSQVGGKIQTLRTLQGPVETAANAIFTNEDVLELIDELDLSPVEAGAKLKRKIWWKGSARTFPFSLALPLRLALGIFRRPPDYREGMSIFEFFRPMLGNEYADKFLSAVFGGIYAIDSKQLCAQSVFTQDLLQESTSYFSFFNKLRKQKSRSGHKSKSISFRNGMTEFIEALRNELKDEIRTEKHFANIEKDSNIIICSNAHEAAEIFQAAGIIKIANELREIGYQKVATITAFTKKPIPSLEKSFGILFPKQSGFSISGILHNSAIFTSRVQDEESFSYTLISPGEDLNDEEILNTLNRLSPKTDALKAHEIEFFKTYWDKAIPKYDKRRLEAIKRLRIMMHELPEGVAIFGNYVDGISIREMVTHAKRFAQKISYAKLRK